MKKQYNLLVSFDDRYVDKAMKMLFSLKLFNDCFFNVLIYYIDLSSESILKVKKFFKDNKIGKVNFYKYEIDTSLFPIYLDHTSVETYIRLFVPFILSENIDKILYLDCDIICNGDITNLYDTDISNYYVAASVNKPPIGSEDFNIDMNINLGLPKDNKYINAGVLLINVKKIKEDYSIEKINNFISDKKEILIMQDQDIINKLFYKKIKIFSNIYNYQINSYSDDKINNKAVLIHYSDSLKPWNSNYTSKKKAKFYYDILKKLGKNDELEYLLSNSVDIIIPIYNSKSTLERALNSILKLNNKDEIKVYIIDDGSKEKYDEIINKFKNNLNITYHKFKVNEGPGYARNYGISISNSKFISFLDSDDYYSSEYSIIELVDEINKTGADEVRSTFKRIGSDYELDFRYDSFGVHGKLYRRSFIENNNIKFSETRSFEDTYFNNLIYLNDGIISDIEDLTYYWHEGSASLSVLESEENKLIDYVSNMYNLLKDNIEKDTEKLACLFVDCLFYAYSNYNSVADSYIEKIVTLMMQNNINIDNIINEVYYDSKIEFNKFISRYKKKDLKVINNYNLSNVEEKNKLLKNIFADYGDDNLIEVPINTNCGGKNVHIGSGVYINYGLSLVDNGNIYIGDDTFIGPNVNILTLNHAVDPQERIDGGLEIKDVNIGKNVWIGAAVVILPGVTIGDNSVIGAGSVVTKDIPNNCLACGNPCIVIKKI